MKFRLFSINILLVFPTAIFVFEPDQEKFDDWKNPDVIGINKDNPYRTYYPFDIKEDVIPNNPKKLPNHRSNK